MFTPQRFLALLVSFCCATTAMAGEGWYVGAGAVFTDLEATMLYKSVGASGTEVERINQSQNKTEAGGQVHGGYQWLFPLPLGLASFAIEVAGEFQSVKLEEQATISTRTTPIEAQFTLGNSLVLTAKPGYFITNNILIYAEVGGVYSQFKDIKTDAGAANPTPADYVRFGEYTDKEEFGFRVGAGLNFLVTKTFSIEAGWRYTVYSDFQESRYTQPDVGTQEQFDISDLRTQQGYIGLHYYFD